jgi:catechol 2,3-dioxygenase-like lactoylglutathione lyase family enzyme
MFKETHPILGTRDIQRAIEFYTRRLGFQLAFRDKTNPPNYVGFRRDAVELHMQFQFEHEMGTIRLRFLVADPDALVNEYRQFRPRQLSERLFEMQLGTFSFILQDYYVEDWANNFVMHVLVTELDRWWQHISSLDLAGRYGVKPLPPRQESWGVVAGLVDPCGVLWRFTQAQTS